ncbi:hypothetical protein FQ082_01970 [Psychrobacter sp. ANT_H56B]|uniref:helix-turn-helix domain-containing protein n=1 Tax=Psychrobacter sp. ANT_H56B TaxID=2597353 RepID=UPI0011F0B762|nr:helix-turn-helix domain-containing protein [Psychrobacter sp. ANT_H56B]KAA0929512.1 hypothetical protein FQ082_01970 [Psychrobacter sp. ANT_H56B]
MITPQQTVTATQIDIIKKHLMTGATISKLESYERYQIMCLAQRVHDLRKAGMEIQSKSIIKNGKRFNLYWLEEEERARYVSGNTHTITDVHGTSADVWLSNDDIDVLLSTLTACSKDINLLAKFADIENTEEGNKINDYSKEVSDIAMRFTQNAANPKQSCNSTGTWFKREYLDKLKLSIDGTANSLGAMVVRSRLVDVGVSDGVSDSSMRLSEISVSIEKVMISTETSASVKE